MNYALYPCNTMQYTCNQTRLRLRRHWLSGCPSCGSLVRKFIDRIQPSTKLFSNTIRIITLVINRSREPAFSFQLDLCHTMGLFHLLSPPSSIQNQFPSYYGPDLILISLHTLSSFQIFNLDIDQLRPNSHCQATRRVNNSSYSNPDCSLLVHHHAQAFAVIDYSEQ